MNHDNCTEIWTLADGSRLTLRHIAPTDAASEQEFLHGLSPESRYHRFHRAIKHLSEKELERFTNLDSRNAVALIVLRKGKNREKEIGVARYEIDADGVTGEFGIAVADAWQNRGIGARLMEALLRHFQEAGGKQISGYVLKTNSAMRRFARQFGFAETDLPDDPSIVLVTKQMTDERGVE